MIEDQEVETAGAGCCKVFVLTLAVLAAAGYVVHSLEESWINWRVVLTTLAVCVPFAIGTFWAKHRYEWDKYVEDRRTR